MMMLRMMMLRHNDVEEEGADPKTKDLTLCEPAQAKCTSNISQEPF